MSPASTLRGTVPGRFLSSEAEENVAPPPVQDAMFTCESCAKDFTVPLHAEAKAPATWPCRCGGAAQYMGDRETGEDLKLYSRPDRGKGAATKTHFEHLLERRSVDELEALLAKRLDDLRHGRLARPSI